MSKTTTSILDFPVEKYNRVKQELVLARHEMEKEKRSWMGVRNALLPEKRQELDQQFKTIFEQLPTTWRTSSAAGIRQQLQELVQQGASAHLLGDDELGSYNLAMLIEEIRRITTKEELETLTAIARLTIISGANQYTQKAYVGNGGATSLEFISWFLGAGLGNGELEILEQYTSAYTIFYWLIGAQTEKEDRRISFPANDFLAYLKPSPAVTEKQESIVLAMICLGLSPFSTHSAYWSVNFFNRIAAVQQSWLSLLLPYRTEHTEQYVNTVVNDITPSTVEYLLNAFTSSNATRKHFRDLFSMQPHWLLQYIIHTTPAMIFGLVNRNEKELLVPFLKLHKQSLLQLRDEKGNTLLHEAAMSRSLTENTIQLLRNAGFSLQALNQEGLTPAALAEKHKRTEKMKWLK
jgi:hypothetical protein